MWSSSKGLLLPLDPSIKSARELPYTISYVIRKRQQIDNLMELPKEKRPPDEVLWHPRQKRLEEWLDSVLGTKGKDKPKDTPIHIPIDQIEG